MPQTTLVKQKISQYSFPLHWHFCYTRSPLFTFIAIMAIYSTAQKVLTPSPPQDSWKIIVLNT